MIRRRRQGKNRSEKRRRDAERGPCTYCPSPAETEDHIPPQCLFFSPAELIAVPSCFRCNNEASLDDEYFRAVLVLDERAGGHAEAQKLVPAVLRSFKHRPGLKKIVLRHFEVVPKFTPSGLIVGTAGKYYPDGSRMENVVNRVTRGLYRKHFSEILPYDWKVSSKHCAWLGNDPSSLKAIYGILDHMKPRPGFHIGDGRVFSYRFAEANDDRRSTIWIMAFYRGISFVCFGVPPAPPATPVE